MKTILNKSILALILTTSLLMSCVNDDDYNLPLMDCTETSLAKNMEPSDIVATSTVKRYNGPKKGIIEAYVVSSDIAGNFFKSISLQTLDGSVGFSVPVDVTTVFKKFEPGRKVLIELDSTYVDIKFGSLRIGALFNGGTPDAEVGRLSKTDFETIVHRSCTKLSEEELVQKLSIVDTKKDKRINTLIELQNVKFIKDAVGKTYYDKNNQLGGATNYYIVDEAGNKIIFRTSSFANYKDKKVPNGSGTVRGVLTKFNSDYQFIARSESDIRLTNPRVGQ